jgi:hypothetical protein
VSSESWVVSDQPIDGPVAICGPGVVARARIPAMTGGVLLRGGRALAIIGLGLAAEAGCGLGEPYGGTAYLAYLERSGLSASSAGLPVLGSAG